MNYMLNVSAQITLRRSCEPRFGNAVHSKQSVLKHIKPLLLWISLPSGKKRPNRIIICCQVTNKTKQNKTTARSAVCTVTTFEGTNLHCKLKLMYNSSYLQLW